MRANFKNIASAALAANLPACWYPTAKRYGQSLRIGNVQGDPGESLSICLSSGAWKDHATGEAGGDLISLYAAREGIGQGAAKQRLAELLGDYSHVTPVPKPDRDKQKNNDRAIKIWKESIPITGTPAERYLQGRGLITPPSSLRYHSATYHGPTKQNYAALIAAITSEPNIAPHAIHRTFIDGGRKAEIKPSRMMLGEINGGAVRLGQVTDILAVAEGIETALSFQQMANVPTWAVLSASNYRSLILPVSVKEILIAADNDQKGLCAAYEAAEQWSRKGYRVKVIAPEKQCQDWNDVLMSKD